ncbi:Rv3654c family TadE-like protein [Nocardia sp. R16R-3T]
MPGHRHGVTVRSVRVDDRIGRGCGASTSGGRLRRRGGAWRPQADDSSAQRVRPRNRVGCGGRAVESGGEHWLDRAGQALEADAVGAGRRDEGIATVFACLALAALIGATLLIAQVGVVVVARHRAQAAADLAALAAAGELTRGADVGCAQAEEIARRMGLRIQRCEVVHWDATVTVEGNVPMGLLGKRTVRAVARAGPVEVGE